MDTQSYYDRKRYVEQVRNSFSENGTKKKSSYVPEVEEEDHEVRGFFKVRFALALALFLAFLFIQQADISYENINASNIVKQIRSTISLPEDIPAFSHLIQIE